MTRLARLSLLALLAVNLTGVVPAASAQSQPAKSNAKRAAKPAAADPLEEARRTTAVSLVTTLADEARNFGDQVLRARVQARAADALWETDRERARSLFRRAWDAAETADREQGEERARQAASRGAASSRDAGSIRREVLRLAARRDSALGTEFLGFLEGAKKQEATDAAGAATANQPPPTQPFNPDDPPTAMTQRLNLATQLLEDGEVERALQFADPALYPVNTFGANFLDRLREVNAAAADERYMRLLARATQDPAADANTVSLLSTYVFTPFMYIVIGPDGGAHTRRWRADNSPPATLAPAIRDAFLRTAAAVLTRPLPPPDQDRSTAGRMGTYVMLTRLAPLFERHMPDRAADLRARASALLQDTNEETRRADNPLFTRGLTPEPSREEQVREMLSRVDTAKTADERDRLYFRIAAGLLDTDAPRAREYANKVEDADLRAQLLAFVDFQSVRLAIEAKKPEDALRFTRAGQLMTNVQRSWSLTEVAKLLAKDAPGRAIELLDEAVVEARKIDAASPDRPRALVAVATQLYALDRPRAWELMSEVVKSSNAVTDFSGEDGGLTVRVQLRVGGAMTTSFNIESFNFAGVFALLAREDLNRAVELARGLTGEHTRSIAMLAVARAVLNKTSDRAAN